MRFELGDDQEALRDAVTRVMVEHCSPDRVREVEAGDGFDATLWGTLTAMGLPTMTAPEPLGAGASLVDAQVVCEATGRALAPVPLVQTMVAGAPARGVLPGRARTHRRGCRRRARTDARGSGAVPVCCRPRVGVRPGGERDGR